jgi:hypothetical protein
MAKLTEAERQRILKEYQKLRTLRLLISLPILVGAFGFALTLRDPGYHIGELQGPTLTLLAGAVFAVGLVLHFLIWRCPSCGNRLGRALFCRRCGALFTS